jgi:hypothetical protein
MSDIVELRSKLLSVLAESLFIPSCKKASSIHTCWTVEQVESLVSDILQMTLETLESGEPIPDVSDERKALIERISRQAMTSTLHDHDDAALSHSIHKILNLRDDPIVSINGKLLRRVEVEHLKKALALKDKNNTSNTIQ